MSTLSSTGITPISRKSAVSRFASLSSRAVLIAWIFIGLGVVFTTQLCNTIWALGNPAPHFWDNADYLNLAWQDHWAYQYGGPVVDPAHHPGVHRHGFLGVYDSLMHNDPNRPPGLRIVSIPFVFLGTKMLPTLRAVSLICFWITIWLVYKTVRTVVPGPNGTAGGIVAAMVLSLALEVGWSIRVFGTEYVLYLSAALMMFALARGTRAEFRSHLTWILLGASLGLGLLSKLSFVTLAGPAMIVAVSMSLTGRLPALTIGRLILAGLLGALIAFPYYGYHVFTVIRYGQEMTEFTRHSLNKTGLDFLHAWLSLHVNEGLGLGASLICIALAVLGSPVVLRWCWKNRFAVPEDQPLSYGPAGRVFLLGLAAGVPLPLFQMIFSQSDNHRHITPVYFPLTISIAVAAAASGWLVAWWSWPILLAVLVPAKWQIEGYPLALVNPAKPPGTFVEYTNAPDDVWDWEPLHQMILDRGIRFPYIGRVGNGGQFNEPSIQTPWFSRGDWAYGVWLWKPEAGAYDWNVVRAKLDSEKITVVVTARQQHLRDDASRLHEPVLEENAHDDEFAESMQRLPGWEPAGKFPIGVVNKAEIWVFVRRR